MLSSYQAIFEESVLALGIRAQEGNTTAQLSKAEKEAVILQILRDCQIAT
jgi:hypothetical protein